MTQQSTQTHIPHSNTTQTHTLSYLWEDDVVREELLRVLLFREVSKLSYDRVEIGLMIEYVV